MAAITQTVSFYDNGPGYQHMQSLPAGERSSWVRAACDAAAQKDNETGLLLQELRALNAKLDRLMQKLASGRPVAVAAPEPKEKPDGEPDPRLAKLEHLGL